jgi:hypothetical protein
VPSNGSIIISRFLELRIIKAKERGRLRLIINDTIIVTSTILGQGGKVKRSLFDDTKLGKEEGFGPRELKD